MTQSEMKQLEMLRAKTPEQRFTMMADLIGAQFDAMKSGIKFQNPGITKKEMERLFKVRMIRLYQSGNDWHGKK
ncbi:MAG: hypothetical protein Q7R35_16530 [Elusimicrobiota bacterium]|nr:hypothetical protein [Elusimicrobiota bacterium]